jgi:hypothetical protein
MSFHAESANSMQRITFCNLPLGELKFKEKLRLGLIFLQQTIRGPYAHQGLYKHATFRSINFFLNR